LLLYLILTVAAMWEGLFTGGNTVVGSISAPSDQSKGMWCLAWVPFSLAHHMNPLVTTYADYPAGVNVMWNCQIKAPALLLAPVTALFGPSTSYNVLAVLAVALSSWCAFLAVRRYTTRWVPAVVGGLLYGFSPFIWSMTGTLDAINLSLAMFPPLLVIFADEILVRQRRSPMVLGPLLGVVIAAQLMTDEEMLAITAVMAVPALAAFAIIRRHEIRSRIAYAAETSGWALVVFLVLAAYPLYVQFLGPQAVSGILHPNSTYAAPPLAFILPTANQLLAKLGVAGPTTTTGFQNDTNVFIGIPLLALALISAIWLRKRGVVVVAAATTLCAIVLAVGPSVNPQKVAVAGFLPSVIIRHLPLLENIQPERIMVVGYLGLAVLVAIFLDMVLGLRRVEWRMGGAALTLVALVPLVPSVPYPSQTYAIPSFFTDGAAQRLPSDGSVLISPPGDPGPVAWWAVSGLPFRSQLLFSFVTPTSRGSVWDALDEINWYFYELGELGKPTVNFIAKQRAECIQDLRYHDVTTIIVGPSKGEAQVIRFVTDLLGRPGTSVGGVVVWYGVNTELPHVPASTPAWETRGDPPLSG
jgi:hypothetical protein